MKNKKIDTNATDRLRRMASLASVSVAVTLVAAKLSAYIYTNALSLLSSLVDSGVDVLASILTAIGVWSALQPPDRDHRFGHGKAESLAALAQAAFIVGSSLLLAFAAFDRFANPIHIEHVRAGYIVMGFSIAMTFALLGLQNVVVKRTGSLAISADRMHYASDALINVAVIVSLFVQSVWGFAWVDPLATLLIAVFMMRGAYGIGKESLSILMDAELPETDREAIRQATLTTPGVEGAHDLRTRSDSVRPIIEVHVEMDQTLTLGQAHKIVEKVERRLKKLYPHADVLIHQDPAGNKEERLDVIIERNDPLP